MLLLLPCINPRSSETSPAMVSIKLSVLCVVAIALAVCAVSDGKVMMEYIGSTGIPVSLDSFPIKSEIHFHFVLGYAIDTNVHGASQHGVFSPYWQSSITPASIQSIKSRYPNVKVLASLSGWEGGYRKAFHWYRPKHTEAWISNAVKSLTTMVSNYHLDGIDINYNSVSRNDTSFEYCIGELITRLKYQKAITVATIAPNYWTALHYSQLYRKYPNEIDYVNYQFYTERTGSPHAYLQAYNIRAAQFNTHKLLASYKVNGRGIQGDRFFEALKMIESNGYRIDGVVIFSADASSSTGYYFEKKSQEFLLNPKSFH